MKPNRFISIRLRLVLFFAFFVLTIISSHFLTRGAFENLGEYQIIINRAGQNNEIIEQILNYAKQITENQRMAVALLNSDIRRFDLNLELLEKGGGVMVEEEKIILPPCVPEVKPIFEELSQLWYYQFRDEAKVFVEQEIFTDTIFESGRKALTERAESALKKISENRERLITANSRLIEKYLEISKQQRDRANLWLWGLLGVNLSLIAIGLYLVQLWVVRPLLQISQVAQSIGEGDLSQKITYYRRNEVGQVAEAINEMVDKIRNATDFIKSIEQGDLSVSYTQTNGQTPEKDALAGALINMRERMKAVALEEEERNWVTEGLAKFGQILQTFNEDTEQLSYEIVSNVVDYVQANQGGLFIANKEAEQETFLELVASYAFQRRRFSEKKLRVGEGLVGQSFKDGDTIYITDIPDNYVDITSGLGGSTTSQCAGSAPQTERPCVWRDGTGFFL
ncbi:MAG: HAMP domain-containing protein [Microscillaceae bacterium]|nr:HAMP domain-containing protein [Microscillaceae bacterium]